MSKDSLAAIYAFDRPNETELAFELYMTTALCSKCTKFLADFVTVAKMPTKKQVATMGEHVYKSHDRSVEQQSLLPIFKDVDKLYIQSLKKIILENPTARDLVVSVKVQKITADEAFDKVLAAVKQERIHRPIDLVGVKRAVTALRDGGTGSEGEPSVAGQ
jgi:predicted P-loop ATPase/GTPase